MRMEHFYREIENRGFILNQQKIGKGVVFIMNMAPFVIFLFIFLIFFR